MAEKMEFQTEVKQLLQLMIHSLYSHKEIFLRELISNSSDALDKIRFESLTNSAIACDPDKLKIRINPDKESGTIVITDNGIGMNHDELIANLGTIARSGSKAFLESLSGDQKADSNLIGQFGVGFYSVFMVATKVEVLTRRAGSEQAFRWISEGEGSFEIEEASRAETGTDIIITLNDESKNYAEIWELKSLIKKYSNFIAFPVELKKAPEWKDGKEVEGPVEFEIVNNNKPIWTRSTSEVTEDEYAEFFSGACGGFGKPLKTIHTKAEGTLEYSSIMYLPESISPFESNNIERKHGVKLYVRKVFISDEVKELIPGFFRFVKGVVDTDDLPLNVSREILQDNPMIKKIGKALTGKIFAEIKKMAEKEPEEFAKFWKQTGTIIKEGLHSEYEHRDNLLEIVRFNSTVGGDENYLTSFKEYVGRMREGQKHIYYINAENYATASKSPHLELFRANGIEVLYLTDPIDEFVVPQLYKVEDKELKSITAEDLDLGDLISRDEKAEKKEEKRLGKFLEGVKEVLESKLENVRLTYRLKESPACLVSGAGSMTAQMEQMMRAMGQPVPESKQILELNASHPIVNNLNDLYGKDPKNDQVQEWITLLYEQALIAEGRQVPDQTAYLNRVNKMFEAATKNA